MIQNISIIGTGNLAFHWAKKLHALGFNIVQIFGRNLIHAQNIASFSQAVAINDLQLLKPSDLHLLVVSDDAIADIIQSLDDANQLICHCSGAVSLDVFNTKKKEFGVIYPLQSFSKEQHLDWKEVPIFIEGNNATTQSVLTDFAKKISNNVSHTTSQERLIIHLAAVFGHNFTNALWQISTDLLHLAGKDLGVLMPLLTTSLDKIRNIDPITAQTGPAKRGDLKTMQKHLELLATISHFYNREKCIALYNSLSELIQSNKNKPPTTPPADDQRS